MKSVIIGTRGSQLALAQAELVKQALEQLPQGPEIVVRIVRTTGDRRLDINLSQSGAEIGKGLFTKELEEALLRREIDVAVHSLKDLPTELSPELALIATLPRHDPVDVLLSKSAKSLREVPAGGRRRYQQPSPGSPDSRPSPGFARIGYPRQRPYQDR